MYSLFLHNGFCWILDMCQPENYDEDIENIEHLAGEITSQSNTRSTG